MGRLAPTCGRSMPRRVWEVKKYMIHVYVSLFAYVTVWC